MILLQLFSGFLVGIYSYLMPGYINMNVLHIGSKRNQNSLFKIIAIITLVEIPYCLVCMSALGLLTSYKWILNIVAWLIVLALLLMSIFTWRDAKKNHPPLENLDNQVEKNVSGKLIAFIIFNPFQLSAWAIWGAYFLDKKWFAWDFFSLVYFSLATTLGVFVILRIYAYMGLKLVKWITIHRKQLDYFLAAFLLMLAIIQVIKNIVST